MSTVTWRWSNLVERGWSKRRWVAERMTIEGTTWFARVALQKESRLLPVILIHGLVVSGTYFRPITRHLDKDICLYVLDLPGFGRSTTGVGTWSLHEQADGLATWMRLHELSDAIFVGNSLGCQVLTLLAIHHPELVHELILVAPTMDPTRSTLRAIIRRGLQDIPRERQSLWSIWIPDFFRAGPVRAIRSLRAGFDDPQGSRLGNIQQPVLVVGGELDPIVTSSWIEEMATLVPNGTSIIVRNATHAMNYSDPKAIARIIQSALDR